MCSELWFCLCITSKYIVNVWSSTHVNCTNAIQCGLSLTCFHPLVCLKEYFGIFGK